MVSALDRHPGVNAALHYSGPLIDWLEQNQPAFLDRLASMVDRGQVEMVSGAYYEPILPAIPDADKIGQILKMNEYLRKRFGQQPTGMWLAERVWEPHLPKFIAEAGLAWTVLDDTHFRYVGMADEELLGHYLTEEEGRTLSIFPTSKTLRYAIPWWEVERAIEFLLEAGERWPGRLLTMGDDGEKFGIWPETDILCWEKGWVDKFFSELERHSDQVQMVKPAEALRSDPPTGRVYLPTASYAEMGEWSLPAESAVVFHELTHQAEKAGDFKLLSFLRGGFWRSFLVKYDEINQMHKRAQHLSHQIHGRKWRDDSRHTTALNALWRAQCNCSYWHGVFGGVYLNDVRSAVYVNLIKAEDEMRADGWSPPAREARDIDLDGTEELVLCNARSALYVDPAGGGIALEWDSFVTPFNLVDVVARRPEAYHRQVSAAAASSGEEEGVKSIHEAVRSKESDLAEWLNYDDGRRGLFRDRLFERRPTVAQLERSEPIDCGDFGQAVWEVVDNMNADQPTVTLEHAGLFSPSGRQIPLSIRKTIRLLDECSVELTVEIVNRGQTMVSFVYASELNLNILGGRNPSAWLSINGGARRSFDATGETDGVAGFVARNDYLGLEVEADFGELCHLLYHSVETISSSEGGFERVHQGTAFVPCWNVKLVGNQSKVIRLKMTAR